jgi:DNA-3-methyladenine glycosylase II
MYTMSHSHFLTHSITNDKLADTPDDAVISCLTEIKGVGMWDAEMVLMFSLGREDVFAVDDGGLAQGMIALYGIDPTNTKQLKQRMQTIAANWHPYRTYGCRLVWRYKDLQVKL